MHWAAVASALYAHFIHAGTIPVWESLPSGFWMYADPWFGTVEIKGKKVMLLYVVCSPAA
jgi:hypothetical protein